MADIVDTMTSYTKLSPSGTALRITFKAVGVSYDKKRYYSNRCKIDLEVYVAGMTNHFITSTGNDIRECGIESRTIELMIVLEKHLAKEVKERKSKAAVPGNYLTDKSIICKTTKGKLRPKKIRQSTQKATIR